MNAVTAAVQPTMSEFVEQAGNAGLISRGEVPGHFHIEIGVSRYSVGPHDVGALFTMQSAFFPECPLRELVAWEDDVVLYETGEATEVLWRIGCHYTGCLSLGQWFDRQRQQSGEEEPKGGRKLSVWLQFPEQFTVGEEVKLYAQFEAPVGVPNWNGLEELDLLVGFEHGPADVSILPSWQHFRMPKLAATQPIEFKLVSHETRTTTLTVSVFTAREYELLMEYSVELPGANRRNQ